MSTSSNEKVKTDGFTPAERQAIHDIHIGKWLKAYSTVPKAVVEMIYYEEMLRADFKALAVQKRLGSRHYWKPDQ
jgi:hypothetical protein